MYLTVDQVRYISDHASEQVRAAIWIALLTGYRRGEIHKIEKTDISDTTITIKQGNTKTLRERVCPIVPALRPWLEYVPLSINFEGSKNGIPTRQRKSRTAGNHFSRPAPFVRLDPHQPWRAARSHPRHSRTFYGQDDRALRAPDDRPPGRCPRAAFRTYCTGNCTGP